MTMEVDDFIKHYGKKGMRWGVRKSEDSSGGSSKPRRPKNADIKAARSRQDDRVRDFQEKSAAYYTSRSSKGEAFAERTMRNAEWDLFNNPDVAVAGRMTTGEKWVTGFFVAAPVVVAALSTAARVR